MKRNGRLIKERFRLDGVSNPPQNCPLTISTSATDGPRPRVGSGGNSVPGFGPDPRYVDSQGPAGPAQDLSYWLPHSQGPSTPGFVPITRTAPVSQGSTIRRRRSVTDPTAPTGQGRGRHDLRLPHQGLRSACSLPPGLGPQGTVVTCAMAALAAQEAAPPRGPGPSAGPIAPTPDPDASFACHQE